MDQPTAQEALKKLEPLLGDWVLEASTTGRRALAGRRTIHVCMAPVRSTSDPANDVELPEAPNSLSVMGCDAANGTYFQLYSDERGVCRVYEMSIGDGEWKLWRKGQPFDQRFIATISEDGNTIAGRWEKSEDGRRLHDRLRPGVSQDDRVDPVSWRLIRVNRPWPRQVVGLPGQGPEEGIGRTPGVGRSMST